MGNRPPRIYRPTLAEAAEVWACDAQVRVFWATEPEAAKRLAFAKLRAHRRGELGDRVIRASGPELPEDA